MKKNKIEITKMTVEDIDAIYEIDKNSVPIPWTKKSFEEEINNMLATTYVAKIDNNIVGFIVAWFVLDECHIGNIAISPEYRKQGIASLLLDKIIDDCSEHEANYILLEVRVSNIPAISLYTKYGFSEDGIRKGYYKNPNNTYEDAMLMSLQI